VCHDEKNTLPPPPNIYFYNLLIGLLCFFSAGPANGQAAFQAEILETGDPARKFLISQQVGEIENYWIVDINVAAMDSLIQSQGGHISFQFDVGALFRWGLSLSESYVSTVGADTLWTKYSGEADGNPDMPVDFVVSGHYFKGEVKEAFYHYQFFSMYGLSPSEAPDANHYILTEKKAEDGPAARCNLQNDDAAVEIAIVVDLDIYNFYQGDEDFIRDRATNIVYDAFGFFNQYNSIPIGPRIREIIIRRDEPINCGTSSLSRSLSDYWHRSRPCIPLDAFIVFSGQGCFPDGNSTTFGICPMATNYPPVPLIYPLAVIQAPDGNLLFTGGIPFNTAHEIGHLLTGKNHVEEDSDYASMCPELLSQCNSGNEQGLYPMMCRGGGRGDRDFDAVYIDACTCEFIEETLERHSGLDGCLYPPDESSIPELPCPECNFMMDVQTGNPQPIIGCGGQSRVDYTVEICNFCEDGTFDFEVFGSTDREIVDTNSFFPSGLELDINGNSRYIRLSDFTLNFDECLTIQFSTEVIGAGTVSNSVRVREATPAAPIIVSEIFNLYPVSQDSLTPVSGPLSAQTALNPPGGDCASSGGRQTIEVNGDFIIDLDNIPGSDCYTFDENSVIKMAAGARVIVSGGTLSVIDSKIFSCDSLWQSIIVQPGARLEMRGCTVSDGENAVALQAGAEAEIRDNTFRNNYTGILVDLAAGENAFLSNCYGNTFLAEGLLKAPRDNIKGFAGIWLKNDNAAVGLAGQAPNIFEGLYNGILALNTNLRVTNCVFRDIRVDPNVLLRPAVGRGVYAYTDGMRSPLLLVSGGEGNQVAFEGCTVGIGANGANAFIFSTLMDDVDTGIRLQRCQDKVLRVEGNTVAARDIGLALLQNNPAYCYAAGNSFQVQASDSFRDPAGILVEEDNYGARSYNRYILRENTAEISFVGTGIKIGAGHFVQVHSNTVLLQDEDGGKTGLRLSGTTDAWLRCNTVMGPPGASYGTGSYGFDAAGASGTLFSCNTTSNTRLGFRFDGMGDGVKFQGNTMQDHFNGLLIGETGTVGAQFHNGNLWCGQYADAGVGARHLGNQPFVFQSQFIIDPDFDGGNCEILPQWAANGDWFIPQVPEEGEETFICQDEVVDACTSATPGVGIDEPSLEKILAEGAFQSPQYKEALEWTGRRHLYRRLLEKEAAELELWEEDFLSEMETGAVGQFSEIEAALQSAFALDSITMQSLAAIQDAVRFKLDSLHWVGQQFNSEEEVDTVSLLALRAALMDSLLYFQAYAEDEARAIAGARSAAAEGILVDNNEISVDSIYESNEQLVNAIFLQTIALGIDTFTLFQENKLLEVAGQCPLSGGDAVFRARSMYSLVDPLAKYDDEALCAPAPEARPQPGPATEVLEFQLMPNPSQGEISIRLAKPLDEDARIIIYDTQGHIHKTQRLEAGEARFRVEAGQLPPGLYVCKLMGKGHIHSTCKLAIIR